MLPVKGRYTVTAVYGQTGNYWANGHKGIDFVAENKNVYAVSDGVVRVVSYDPTGWGNYISVGVGDERHLYCHLDSVDVIIGQSVRAGQKLGVMGKTGNVTGVHLHYQLNDKNGTPKDPAAYLGIPNKTGVFGGDSLYKDDKKISSWAKEDVYAAKEKGYLVGDADGNFRPRDPLTREEAALLIMKLERN